MSKVAGRHLRRKVTQQHQIDRTAGHASNQVRTAHQPEDRKALGLTVPDKLLAFADEAIE